MVINPVDEFILLLNILLVILSLELGTYAIYKYTKIHYQNLPLHNILLLSGCFFLLNIIRVLFLIISKYSIGHIEGPFISGLIVQLNIIPLSVFIILGDFSKYIKKRISYGFIGSIILLISLGISFRVIFPSNFIINYTIQTISCGAFILYFLGFGMIVYKKRTWILRTKLLYIISGMIMGYFSLPFTFGPLDFWILDKYSNLSIYIGTALHIIAIFLILLGIYNFPTFYEFRWAQNLLHLYIINQTKNSILYKYDFSKVSREEGEELEEKNLTSPQEIPISGLTGVDGISRSNFSFMLEILCAF